MAQCEIGGRMTLDGRQMAVITGEPTGSHQPGAVFSWGPGRFKVDSVTPAQECVIVRLAVGNELGTEPGIQNSEPFHPRSVQRSPTYLPGAGVDTGIPPVTTPMTHDQLYPREGPGRETMQVDVVGPPEADILGPRRTSPHPPADLSQHQVNEPEDTGRKLSSEQALYKMFGFKRGGHDGLDRVR
jgi:hypothetical protein